MLSLAEARGRILDLAEPGEPIEVALTEALGLVLAEPAVADVDWPPFDRAATDGFAVCARESGEGAKLGVVRRGRSRGEVQVGTGQAARVATGDPMPVGADAVVPIEECRPIPEVGPPREVLVLRPVESGRNIVGRGSLLRAGTELAPAGTRLRLPMVGLLASQGCMHPVCHRRVRVAVLAVGDQLVGAAEAPVMHRERNAAGPAVVAPCLHWGACAHDLGAVGVRDLEAALARALTAPVVVLLGEADASVRKALGRAGVETVISGVAMDPGGALTYGVVRGESGMARHHVFHLGTGPVSVFTSLTLLASPLIARLQGGPLAPGPRFHAVWDGSHPPTDDRLRSVPVLLAMEGGGRWIARPVECRGDDDLAGFARAEALALLPARSGPWRGGEVVEVAPMGPWSFAAP